MTHDDPQLDAYLDGTLAPHEREDFERRLEASPNLRAQADLQRRIDRSLKSLIQHDAPIPSPLPASTRARTRNILLAAAAAVILLVSALYALLLMPRKAPFHQPAEVYARLVAAGFEPRETCDNDEEFIRWTLARFGEPLLIPADTPGVEIIGWDYRGVLTPRTAILLARVQDRPVILLLDHKENARRLARRPTQDLRVFHATRGSIALYEITPLQQPTLIPAAAIAPD